MFLTKVWFFVSFEFLSKHYCSYSLIISGKHAVSAEVYSKTFKLLQENRFVKHGTHWKPWGTSFHTNEFTQAIEISGCKLWRTVPRFIEGASPNIKPRRFSVDNKYFVYLTFTSYARSLIRHDILSIFKDCSKDTKIFNIIKQ